MHTTFAARVTTGTLSDMYSAITTAIGTLKGPLHGGANERVMKMLKEIGSMDRIMNIYKTNSIRKKKLWDSVIGVYKRWGSTSKAFA